MATKALSMRQRVKAGAEWLDKAVPGWAELINQDLLSTGSCHHCVMGQLIEIGELVRSKSIVCDKQGQMAVDAYGDSLGFDLIGSEYEVRYTCFHVLKDMWLKEIEARLQKESKLKQEKP